MSRCRCLSIERETYSFAEFCNTSSKKPQKTHTFRERERERDYHADSAPNSGYNHHSAAAYKERCWSPKGGTRYVVLVWLFFSESCAWAPTACNGRPVFNSGFFSMEVCQLPDFMSCDLNHLGFVVLCKLGTSFFKQKMYLFWYQHVYISNIFWFTLDTWGLWS